MRKVSRNKILPIIFSLLLVSLIIFLIWRNELSGENKRQSDLDTNTREAVSSRNLSDEVDFAAAFEIYTHGTKRIFTDVMYHNQSNDVYIEVIDSGVVQVRKHGTTWDDFFKTLPFSLTKECLVTGTKQTFCKDESNELIFTLNGVNTPDALNEEIKEGDRLVVTYGN